MDRIKNLTSDLWHGLKEDSLPRAEDAVPPEELALMMRRASSPTFSFFLMMALATSIATLGLLADSAPAIIGAMIVAPLMAPIMSLAYGLVDFDVRLTVRSAFTVAAGTALVIGFAYVQTLIVGLRIAESEILDRTSPSLIDLGVAVAAGAAAAFAYSRRSIMNSIAGVAIAVAVVPPLAVAGIGLAMGPTATAGVGLTPRPLFRGCRDRRRGLHALFDEPRGHHRCRHRRVHHPAVWPMETGYGWVGRHNISGWDVGSATQPRT